MRDLIDIINLSEGFVPEDGFTQSMLMKGIYHHIKQQIDPDMTWSELKSALQEVKSHLKFPLTIYRGMHFPEYDGWFNAQDDHHDPEQLTTLYPFIEKIDFNEIGSYWTWDKKCAAHEGALGGGDDVHVILTAVIPSRSCDLLTTLWQNLTIYQEEKEVTVFPNTPIKITEITPMPSSIKLPIKANTGNRTGWAGKEDIMQEIKYALNRASGLQKW